MPRPDNQVREEFIKLALELVNDRFEKEIAKRQNDALLTQSTGEYELPEDNRASEARRIASNWFDFYSQYGGDSMFNSIKSSYELANQQFQDAVDVKIFNAVKYTDETQTEILSRAAYALPTDRRETDTVVYALDYYNLINGQ